MRPAPRSTRDSRTRGRGRSSCSRRDPGCSPRPRLPWRHGETMRSGAIVLVTSVVLGIIAAPAVVEAQTAGRVYRVGTLSIATPAADLRGPEPRSRALAALLQRLRELGYVPG